MAHLATWTASDALRRLIGLAFDSETSTTSDSIPPAYEAVAFDVSVQGYIDDEQPVMSGASLMAAAIQGLQRAQIRSCFAGTSALVYYGAHRIMLVCIESNVLYDC